MPRLIFLLSCFFILACAKEKVAPRVPPVDPPIDLPMKPPDSAWVTVFIDNMPLVVSGFHFDRGGSWFDFSAWNSLQRVDGYVFRFYGSSGFNYQYSDSLNYSSRPDTASPWRTTRAIDWGDILFDGLTYAIGDSVVNGTYTGNFSSGKNKLVINSQFHGLFP